MPQPTEIFEAPDGTLIAGKLLSHNGWVAFDGKAFKTKFEADEYERININLRIERALGEIINWRYQELDLSIEKLEALYDILKDKFAKDRTIDQEKGLADNQT